MNPIHSESLDGRLLEFVEPESKKVKKAAHVSSRNLSSVPLASYDDRVQEESLGSASVAPIVIAYMDEDVADDGS